MRVGQPGVEGEQRNLDSEGNEERQEQKHLLGRIQSEATAFEQLQYGRVIESVGSGVDIEDRHEHQGRAGHRVEEEFHGRIDAALVSPNSDEEVHRHEADFPEYEKQKQIHRQKYADQTEFE